MRFRPQDAAKGQLSTRKIAFSVRGSSKAPRIRMIPNPRLALKKPVFNFAARAKHWSFQPSRGLTAEARRAWVRHRRSIYSCEARIRRLKPAQPRTGRTLLAALHLTYWPPPPDEIHSSCRISPRMPIERSSIVWHLRIRERWGAAFCFDLVRFAETDATNSTRDKPAAFEYRDYSSGR